MVEVVNGDALMVKLANGQVKKVFLASIRPPKEQGKPAGEEDGKPAPRPKGFRPLYDIPWMFEAREFLRKKLVGKHVKVRVDTIYTSNNDYKSYIYNTINICNRF